MWCPVLAPEGRDWAQIMATRSASSSCPLFPSTCSSAPASTGEEGQGVMAWGSWGWSLAPPTPTAV